MRKAVEKIRRELVRQNQQAEQGQTAFHREASRLESLKNITERYDGYGNSIRRCHGAEIPGTRPSRAWWQISSRWKKPMR